ncbi:MAG: hypothetical protein KC912_25780 [Proteobacteria bacterium]|nr:hypothetical protein [Pseudomonadota bacterium]
MLTWWLVTALAAPCADVGAEVDAGWAAYNDAELDLAKGHIDAAVAGFACQAEAVSTEELLGLYRLDAIVAITQSDQKGAVYATIRVVTIDPTAAPSPELGPELAAMHETWSERLAENVIRIGYEGDGEAWVDGRRVERPWIEVFAGEHLVQYDGPSGWVSRIDELDRGVTLGPPDAAPPPEPEPIREAPADRPGRRVRRRVLLASGLGLVAGGGGLVLGGSVLETSFLNDPYTDSYGGCPPADDCWADARSTRIRKDAATVRALYGIGYGALGLGAVVLGTELLLLPDPVAGGGSVRFSGRF